MAKKKLICKTIFKVTLFILLLVLFVNYYMWDEMSDYLLKRTTLSTRFEDTEASDFPTITLCMSSGLKRSVARKFGVAFTSDIYNENIFNRLCC